jgi:hypothetical protein
MARDAHHRIGLRGRRDLMVDEREAIHQWFGLTYSNYLVLPRAVLQSMPDEWQHRFVTCLEELADAFGHLEYGAGYDVRVLARHPEEISPECEECEGEGKVPPVDDDGFPTVMCPSCKGEEQEDNGRYETAEEVGFRLDPIPHYNRGRTRIEPRQ